MTLHPLLTSLLCRGCDVHYAIDFLKIFLLNGVDWREFLYLYPPFNNARFHLSKLRQSFSFNSRFSTLRIERNKFDKKFFDEIFFFFHKLKHAHTLYITWIAFTKLDRILSFLFVFIYRSYFALLLHVRLLISIGC